MSNAASRMMAVTAVFTILTLTVLPASAGQVLTRQIPPPGAVDSFGMFIDNSGRVAGQYWSGKDTVSFLYDGGTFVDILPPGDHSSYISDMNESLGIVGNSCGATCDSFLYSNGTYSDIGMPAGATNSEVTGIANNGDMAGYYWPPATSARAWYRTGGAFTEVHPPGSMWSYGYDVNSSARVVGEHYDGVNWRAFLWQGGTFSDPSPPGLTDSSARRINDAGTIIGMGWTTTGTSCWLNMAGTTTIVMPPGASWSDCTGLGEDNTVVGVAMTGSGGRAFVYRDGSYQYLEARGGGALTLWDINSSFQVAGTDGMPFFISQRAAGAGSQEGPGSSASMRQQTAAPGGDDARLPIGGGSQAITGTLLPAPRVATRFEHQMQGNYMPIFSLNPWAYAGQPAEWWVVAQTPSQTYSYDLASNSWVPGFFPTVNMPVRKMGEVILPPAGSQLGIYTYYFGIDFLVNGIVDPQFLVYEGKTVLHR